MSFSNVLNANDFDLYDPLDLVPVAKIQVEWKETPEAHVFTVDIPGVKNEDLKVEIEDERFLNITGERKRESRVENENWHRIVRSYEQFERRFRLPDNAKTNEIEAWKAEGVLTLIVPKLPGTEPEVIQISE